MTMLRPRRPAHAPGRLAWRLPVLALVVALVAWVGMLVAIYPTVAAWVSQYNQSKVVDSYSSEVTSADLSPSVAEQLSEARQYNDALNSGALLEANHRLPTGEGTSSDASMDYSSLLKVDATGVMGRIKIPSIDVDLPIYHGTSDETLLKGVGHLEGTSLPVGGEGTHAVLTGHRGLATATMFTNLDKVGVGDTFTIEVLDQVLTYQVITTKVVDPEDTASLRPQAGKDLVTLVTCTPLGINSQRILVTGQRVTPTPVKDVEAAGETPDIPGFPWWIALVTGGTLVAGLYVWRAGYPARPRRHSEVAHASDHAQGTNRLEA